MTTLLDFLIQGFQTLADEADPRSQDWILSKPFVPFTIIAVYLLLVKKWGPAFMEHRPAFKIKPIIIVYNVFQILACSYVCCEGARLFIAEGYSVLCQPVDPRVSENNDKIAFCVFLYYVIKITDLLDTIFFVLRKKFSHASFLHVYHHAGMIMVGFLGTKFSLNGHFVSLGLINSFVHVVMYSYYLYAALFPEKKVGISIKKSLTMLQLVQFCILAVHNALPVFQPNCQVQKLWSFALVTQYTFMIVLFSDFYKKAYLTPKRKAN